MSEQKSTDRGVGCVTVVGIVLITLKLVGVAPVADWSWWWVTCPFWAPVALLACVAAVAAVFNSVIRKR